MDKAKNVAAVVNESTAKFVKTQSLDCAQNIKQDQSITFSESGTVKIGGDLLTEQNAALVVACAMKIDDKSDLIRDVANDLVQKTKTDKGAAATFQLLSVNDQENINNVTNSLRQEYESASKLNCDTAILQKQKVAFAGKVEIGGSASFKQNSSLTGDCQVLANLANRVAEKVTSKTDQTSTVPCAKIGTSQFCRQTQYSALQC